MKIHYLNVYTVRSSFGEYTAAEAFDDLAEAVDDYIDHDTQRLAYQYTLEVLDGKQANVVPMEAWAAETLLSRRLEDEHIREVASPYMSGRV